MAGHGRLPAPGNGAECYAATLSPEAGESNCGNSLNDIGDCTGRFLHAVDDAADDAGIFIQQSSTPSPSTAWTRWPTIAI